MEEKNKIKQKQIMLMFIGIAILLVSITGITFAFFNYTKTGGANVIKTGNIEFNMTQGKTINLQNVFPITSAEALADNSNTSVCEIVITGRNTYAGGVEYLVSTVNATNTDVPVSILVNVESNGNGANDNLGISDNDYFTNRNSYTTSHYKKLVDDSFTGNEQILVGYIASSASTDNSINGKITIRAYFDKNNIIITDTPDETNTGDKTVMSTSEWNALNSSGVSFQVRVEANEGKWVHEALSEHIVSRYNGSNQDGIVAVNTNGDLYDGTGTIREYRYSGGGRYCTYENGETTYNLQIEGDTCPETAIYGGGPPGLYSEDSDSWNGAPSGTTYTLVSGTGVNEGIVKNYVMFNGELWRIIGQFDGKIKIMKDTPLEDGDVPEQYTTLENETIDVSYQKNSGKKYAKVLYNNGGIQGNTIYTWNDSSLKYYFNEENEGSYYNDININYRNIIYETNFNTGIFDYTNGGTPKILYEAEKNIIWKGKIALLSLSDLGYASSSNNWSKNIKNYWSYGNVLSDNWILHTNSNYNNFLGNNASYYWSDSGHIGNSGAKNATPVLYLKANTLLNSGDGSYANPYTLVVD